MRALDWARARTKTAQMNDSSRSLIFQFLMGSVMDINKLYRYITTFNVMNITIKNIAINTGILWRHPVLGQSEIVFTVAISDVQVTQLSACGDRKNRNHRNLPKSPKSPSKSPKSPLKSGVGGDMGLGGAGRGKTGYVCVKVGLVLIT